MKLTEALFDPSSASESHYELMAIKQAIADIEATTEIDVAPLTAEVAAIKNLLVEQRETTEALKAEAQEILQAHREAAQHYSDQTPTEPPPDLYPFIDLPEGTTVRDLPNANRLFILPDGLILKTTDAHTVMVTSDTDSHESIPGPGTKVEVEPGRIYNLKQDWLETTHEAAGISGLPTDVIPVKLAEGRFSVTLDDGIRINIDHTKRMVAVVNIAGTVDVIGREDIRAIGEDVEIHLQDDGEKGFSFVESGHSGFVENDGTIHLSLAEGADLTVSFPAAVTPPDNNGTDPQNCDGSCGIHCEERQV